VATPVKGLAEATGLEDDSVTVSVKVSDVTVVNDRVLKLVVVGAAALERTGSTVIALVM
jgi:hypothetical protein